MKKICFLFPDQGSQKPQMGENFVKMSNKAKDVFETASEILNYDLLKICTEPNQEKLNETEYAQAAILATSISCFEILKEKNILPSFLVGHSLGQYAALYAANSLSLKDIFKLLAVRIAAIKNHSSNKNGAMCAIIGLSAKEIEKECEKAKGYVAVANYNTPQQTVISGEKETVLNVMENLKNVAKRCVLLNVSAAFHSNLMKDAAEFFKDKIEEFEFMDPKVAIFSNVTANIVKTKQEIKKLLVLHLTCPVLFTKILDKISKEDVSNFLEVGYGKTLCGLVKKTLPNANTFHFNDEPSLLEIAKTLAG